MRWAALLFLVAACSDAAPVVIEVRLPAPLSAAQLTASSGELVPSPRGAWLRVSAETRVTLRHPEACPAQVTPGQREITLTPRVSLVTPVEPVGFDRDVTVELRAGCGEAGEVRWRSPPPRKQKESDYSLSFRVSAATPDPLPWGVVPFSPATRGEIPIEVAWTAPDGTVIVRRAVVAAAARASGLPSISAAASYLLGGDGWRVVSGPRGFEGSLRIEGGRTWFRASQPGRFELVDGAGRALSLRAGRFDETPLDCGRADCHPRATEAIKASRMTTIFQRAVEGGLGADHDLRCALACHTTGEPGLPDGGFVDVARALGVSLAAPPARDGWAALPRPLRRLASVGCTACHGPGAIPEPDARWAILRADVCAVCHDAPPRYPTVAAWRASRKARADADPRTREPGCRECHTTGGFLDAQKLRKLDALPPADVGPIGIACAACHAPHDVHGEIALVRTLTPPPSLGADLPPTATTSSVCLPCHAPPPEGLAVSSAAAMWLGRGGSIRGPAPHASIDCAGCHDARGHDFKKTRCDGCHDAGLPAVDASIAARAAALWAKAGGGLHPAPLPAASPALRDLSLVVADRAAAVHNPAYARALLDAAERVLGAP